MSLSVRADFVLSPAMAWRHSSVVYFDWQALISPLVDVGGGIGSLEMAFTRAYPTSTLQYIIVDIPDTIKASRARVSFVAGDFLAPTLDATRIPRGGSTYLCRHVLRDWTDDRGRKTQVQLLELVLVPDQYLCMLETPDSAG
ncbi:hypothetical protein GY45DRAFT_725772 [Cubamyces sp. BRFM 1775]|nr:hypothetical protein GY45DRAFT_725772 [Cubamyces sp. BRFM 1775]